MANDAAQKTTALAPLDVMRTTIAALTPEFKAALPPQIPVERFVRTIITTLQMNPNLLSADRKSVLATCMKAAQDGLLLDGREAAPVMFKNTCQYLPMVAGILKKMRNSGDIASVDAQTVYEHDFFEYELGDNPKLVHKPMLVGERGGFVAVYAIVKTKDGGVYREVMNKADIEKVRKVSKAKSEESPWNTWYEEMAEKTVLKRIAKRCPSSSDLEQVIDHDNEVVGFVQKGVETLPEKEADAKPSYLRMLTETEEKPQETEKVEATPVPESTPASQVDPPVDLGPKKEATSPEPLLLTPNGPPPPSAGPVISPMEQKAMAAMTEAVGNKRLDKAWSDNVPGNLKAADPEAYKRLEKVYSDRLQSFRAK